MDTVRQYDVVECEGCICVILEGRDGVYRVFDVTQDKIYIYSKQSLVYRGDLVAVAPLLVQDASGCRCTQKLYTWQQAQELGRGNVTWPSRNQDFFVILQEKGNESFK